MSAVKAATLYTRSMSGIPRLLLCLAAAVALFGAAGCRARLVKTTVVNSGHTVLHNIEVDYPHASFGITSLAPGEAFHYTLQLEDAGQMKVEFRDSAEKPHSGKGPYAVQGQEGTLTIRLDGSGKNVWSAHLHPTAKAPKGE